MISEFRYEFGLPVFFLPSRGFLIFDQPARRQYCPTPTRRRLINNLTAGASGSIATKKGYHAVNVSRIHFPTATVFLLGQCMRE